MIQLILNKGTRLLQTFSIYTSKPTTILFLRKARLFVKSRYSRNRQWSKSIVYFGLWFNMISVIWTIYYCYRYIFIFSHLYWLGALVVGIGMVRLFKPLQIATLVKFLQALTYKI